METTPDKSWLKRLIWIEIAILLLLGIYFVGPTIFWNIETIATLSDKCTSADIVDTAKCTEIMRNSGWVLWGVVSIIGATIGLWLAWWGRRIQQKSHLQERFEKATDMLGSNIELVRIGGCRSLMNLGKSDKSMKVQCVRLLFDFINNPYLEGEEKNNCLKLKGSEREEYLCELFSDYEFLRPDIQSAIESFSAIYKHYGMIGIDNERVKLPRYFWENKAKGRVFLIKANLWVEILNGAALWEADLRGSNLKRARLKNVISFQARLEKADLEDADLEGAYLSEAILEGANLEKANLSNVSLMSANFNGANLLNADLQGADISAADMRKVKNLTKEQILSAKWGMHENKNHSGKPLLPKKLARDKDIKEWLEEPKHIYEEEFEDSQ